MVIVEEASAAQPLEYRVPAREVDGRQVPSSGIARPGVTARIGILGVGVDETVRERHLGHDRRYRFLVVSPDSIAPFWSALRSMRVIPGVVARLKSVACGP